MYMYEYTADISVYKADMADQGDFQRRFRAKFTQGTELKFHIAVREIKVSSFNIKPSQSLV